jgi:hypothetical protein
MGGAALIVLLPPSLNVSVKKNDGGVFLCSKFDTFDKTE